MIRIRLIQNLTKAFIFTVLVSPALLASDHGAVLYPAPPGIEQSGDFRVQVDGRDCFVYACDTASFAVFSFSGEAEISVFPSHDVEWADIGPLSAKVRHTVQGNVIRFTIDRPRNLRVELNNEITNPLYLFANPLESDVPSAADSTVRFFKSGLIHEPGEIRLKTGETVYIEGGAIVRGSITAEDANGIRILGRGILDGGMPAGPGRRKWMIDLAVSLSQYSTDRPQDPEERRWRYMDGAWDGVLKVSRGGRRLGNAHVFPRPHPEREGSGVQVAEKKFRVSCFEFRVKK